MQVTLGAPAGEDTELPITLVDGSARVVQDFPARDESDASKPGARKSLTRLATVIATSRAAAAGPICASIGASYGKAETASPCS